MAWTDSIQTAIDNLSATLAEESVNPKPTYNVHGHSMQWNQYRQSLVQAIADLRVQLAQGSPFEEIGQGI